MLFYANNIPVIIKQHSKGITSKPQWLVISQPSIQRVLDINDQLLDGALSGIKGVEILASDYEKTVAEFLAHIVVLEAAGGIVYKKNKMLLIKRMGVWDLPKGKIEKGETVELAAMREVEEECGVQAIIDDKLETTYHTYRFRGKGKAILKVSYWFTMKCVSDKGMKPQVEEDIEKVRWMKKSKVFKKALNNTYPSLYELIMKGASNLK